jgi:hypothetical protein
MQYKEAQRKAKAALQAYKVRFDQVGVTVNLGIRQYKREHPKLRGDLIVREKARRWDSI